MKDLVDRFLSWPLPDSVCADRVACMPGSPHRTGTNLLTAAEALQMLEYVLGDQASSPQPSPNAAANE
jgi:hypothetical protein